MKKELVIEVIRKTKKNQPKLLPALLLVDREAFGKSDESSTLVRTFWNSTVNKIIVAKRVETGAIVGYAAFFSTHDERGSYLMRIAVRPRCQGGGIGRKLVTWMLQNYPEHLELDVSSDNERAVGFYQRIGLVVAKTYQSGKPAVEFYKFETRTAESPLVLKKTRSIISTKSDKFEESKDDQNDNKSENSTVSSKEDANVA